MMGDVEGMVRGCSHRGHHLGNGPGDLKPHFLSEEPPVWFALAGEARAGGRGPGSREVLSVC